MGRRGVPTVSAEEAALATCRQQVLFTAPGSAPRATGKELDARAQAARISCGEWLQPTHSLASGTRRDGVTAEATAQGSKGKTASAREMGRDGAGKGPAAWNGPCRSCEPTPACNSGGGSSTILTLESRAVSKDTHTSSRSLPVQDFSQVRTLLA